MITEFLLLFIIVISFFHYWSFGYWKRKNVFSVRGELLFGSIKNVLLSRKTLIEMFAEIYDKYKAHRLVGFYSFYKPMLLITDPEIIREVLVKEFNSFANNGYRVYAKADPMFGVNPFCTTGLENWKKVRGLHAPLHTPAKLKEMFPLMKRAADRMVAYLKEKNGHAAEVLEFTGYYTIDNVVACAYGFEPNAFSDPENGFVKHATSKLFTSSSLANLSALFFPKLAEYLSLRIVSKHAEEFFISMVKSVVQHKENSEMAQKDLISLLMKYNQRQLDENKPGLSDLEFAGHSMTFYLDGYETSSSELSFMLLELANHPDIQEKLRQEIFTSINSICELDFDKLNSLQYLTMTMNEALRMHPLLPVLSRECTENVCIANTTIEKGTKVFIPVQCLHEDPDFFPEPFTFRPERFAEENTLLKYSFLPFGEGPRMCLGFRFAQLQLKIALVFILWHFKIFPASNKHKEEITNERNAPFVVTPKQGTKLKFQPV